jgi:hypothetical protein
MLSKQTGQMMCIWGTNQHKQTTPMFVPEKIFQSIGWDEFSVQEEMDIFTTKIRLLRLPLILNVKVTPLIQQLYVKFSPKALCSCLSSSVRLCPSRLLKQLSISGWTNIDIILIFTLLAISFQLPLRGSAAFISKFTLHLKSYPSLPQHFSPIYATYYNLIGFYRPSPYLEE